MKEYKKDYRKAGVRWGTIFGIMIVVFMLVTRMIPTPVLEHDDKSWHIVWRGSLAQAAEGTPTGGGFLEFFMLNHSATPATAYDDNVSGNFETWATANSGGYVNADAFNMHIAHSTAFDLVCRVRFNKTHCWNAGGGYFDGSRTRVNVTTSGGGITIADSTGTNVESANNSGYTYIWINVYWNNAGAGYQLNAGGNCTVAEFSIEAEY